MKIPLIDRSNYFRGLLLLIRKDKKVAETEIQLMKQIGKTLGFEPSFCENAISNILENKYILDEAPSFTSIEVAEKFIEDGLYLAFSDGDVHPNEEEWLADVAVKNGIDTNWFLQQKLKFNQKNSVTYKMHIDGFVL